MKSKKNINSKAKIENNTLQPHDVPETIQNETILIYDLTSIDKNETKNINLPITGTKYTVNYDNKRDYYESTDFESFPTIILNGGKKYTVKINGLVSRFGKLNFLTVLDGVEYLVEAVKLGPLNLSGAFYGAVNLIKVPTKLPYGVTNMANMFRDAANFNQSLNNWDVRNVEDMGNMFQNATSFNQPLNNWDVSSVKDMNNMFANAISFNQPLNNWNISSVGDIYLNQNMQNMINGSLNSMFENATSFNQSLHKWNISNPDNNCKNMLDYSGLSQYNYQNTLIGWYNKCKSLLFVPKKIGAKGMIYNKYNKWGISNNTSGNGAISTTTSWILHNDSDKNIFREARSYFDDFIDGDMEVNFG